MSWRRLVEKLIVVQVANSSPSLMETHEFLQCRDFIKLMGNLRFTQQGRFKLSSSGFRRRAVSW